jgi:hypothetical protein
MRRKSTSAGRRCPTPPADRCFNDRMQPDEAPEPAAVLGRPHDVRGYPVPAITPWLDGVPMFAATSTARTLICAVERRCSICGTPFGDAVWRVVAAEEATAMVAALAADQTYGNRAGTAEAPGHLACMLYAAMVCPYLARPNARRGSDVRIGEFVAARGAPRGELDGIGGAVAGFETYEFEVGDQVTFRFSGLVSVRPHRLGIEHRPALSDLLDAGDVRVPSPADYPPYLMSDEAAAEERAALYR